MRFVGVWSHIILVPLSDKWREKLSENKMKALGLELGSPSRMDKTKMNKKYVSVVQGIWK